MPLAAAPPPTPAAPAAIVETHSGIVFFVGDRAYKLKKPVRFGFLDFRERATREQICHREVELNRRLAPDVYLGVADVVGPDGAPCDHLVVMRRLPPDRRLSVLVAAEQPVGDHLRRLAHLLAAFHARAATSPEVAASASRDAVAALWDASLAEIARFVGPVLDPAVADRVTTLASRYLAGRADLFALRIAEGAARDGHGDLLADDIFCLDDGPRVLDCIEFDDRLRWGDVLADVAFLAMDLERLGRPDLATTFLGAYREHAGATWPASLAHHYIAYRALVRAKVTCLRGEQGDRSSTADAGPLLDLAARHLEAGRVRLVIVGGLPGTGKTTLAAEIGEVLGAVVIRSDEVRKQHAGLDPTTPASTRYGEGLYEAGMTSATYATLLERAGACLRYGESVVLDASWHDPAWRAAAREVAGEAVADLTELQCVAPAEVAEARIRARAATGGDASDATVAVARELAGRATPWPEATVVDTSGPACDARELAGVAARLGPR